MQNSVKIDRVDADIWSFRKFNLANDVDKYINFIYCQSISCADYRPAFITAS